MPKCLAALFAAACLLLAPASAAALPGDPPFEQLTPADGATLPVSAGGIPVSFTCPVYRSAQIGEFPLIAGPKDYGVSMSRTSTLGADGRLAEGTLNTASTDPVTADTCNASLGAGGSPPRIQETPGTYYWQVYRLCVGCAGGYEAGPVRTFTLKSNVAPAIRVPRSAYDGYPFIASVTAGGAPAGTVVTIERKAGNGWLKVATANAAAGKAEAVVTLARGRRQLRAAVTLGTDTTRSQPMAVDVKRARNWSTTSRANGSYKGTGSGLRSVTFRITGKGRELRDFDAKVPMQCPGVTAGQPTTQIGTARLSRKVKIAPDGRFVAVATAGNDTAIRLRGRLTGRRVSDGRIELSVRTCSGSQGFSAQRIGR